MENGGTTSQWSTLSKTRDHDEVVKLSAEVERLRGIIAGVRDLAKAHLEFVDGSDREHPETIAARAAIAEGGVE